MTLMATVEPIKELKLAPALRRKLLTKLSTYAVLHGQKKAIEHAMEKAKGEIEQLRDETGEVTLSLEGYSVTLVAPIRQIFNKKKFVEIGGSLEYYNLVQDDVPSKAYTKVTLPGDTRGDN